MDEERKAARAYWRGVEEALGAPSMSKQEVVDKLAAYMELMMDADGGGVPEFLHDAMYFLQLDD